MSTTYYYVNCVMRCVARDDALFLHVIDLIFHHFQISFISLHFYGDFYFHIRKKLAKYFEGVGRFELYTTTS